MTEITSEQYSKEVRRVVELLRENNALRAENERLWEALKEARTAFAAIGDRANVAWLDTTELLLESRDD